MELPSGNEAGFLCRLYLQRAAAVLGISAQAIRQALGGPPPDFSGAAETLGVNEADLRNALRIQ